MIRLLLVDDEAMVRTGLRLILEAEDDLRVVGEAADGVEAIEEARPACSPTWSSWMSACPAWTAWRRAGAWSRSRAPRWWCSPPSTSTSTCSPSVRAGASGFLLKASPPEELVAAIRAAHAGNALVEPRMTKRLLEEFARRPGLSPARRDSRPLGDAHRPGARRAARGGAGPVQRRDRRALYIGEATVKTHVTHILTKLGLRDRIQAVVLAYECGLVEPSR